MAFLDPLNQNTGDLITSGIWNQNIVENPKALKGQSGPLDFEDTFIPINDDSIQELGRSGGTTPTSLYNRWLTVAGRRINADEYRVHRAVREVVVVWETVDVTQNPGPPVSSGHPLGRHQVLEVNTGAGIDMAPGGTGQLAMRIDNGIVGSVWIQTQPPITPFDGLGFGAVSFGALANLWASGKNPYFRIEFVIDLVDTGGTLMFLGFNDNPITTQPFVNENFAGIKLISGVFSVTSGDANGSTVEDTAVTPIVGQRHTIEIHVRRDLVTPEVRFRLDGLSEIVHTTLVPAGDMDFQLFFGAAGFVPSLGIISTMTLGSLIMQEDLSP